MPAPAVQPPVAAKRRAHAPGAASERGQACIRADAAVPRAGAPVVARCAREASAEHREPASGATP